MKDKKSIIKSAAEKLFKEKGYKKTNISEIMRITDMGTGTFYNYYDSKDEVFMDIYMDENEHLKRKIMDKVDMSAHPMQVMEQMMTLNNIGMHESPILSVWYDRELFAKIEKSFREKHALDNFDFMYSSFIEVVKKWQDEGLMVKSISPEMIMAIFGALIQVETHKNDIGIEYFPELMMHMGKFVMDGLLTIPEK